MKVTAAHDNSQGNRQWTSSSDLAVQWCHGSSASD